MNPSPIDYTRSRDNPWGLTPHQCAAMRMYCKYGNAKQAWAAGEAEVRTIQGHVEQARIKIGFRGHDMRSFVLWVRWVYDHDCDRAKKSYQYKAGALCPSPQLHSPTLGGPDSPALDKTSSLKNTEMML